MGFRVGELGWSGGRVIREGEEVAFLGEGGGRCRGCWRMCAAELKRRIHTGGRHPGTLLVLGAELSLT